jgi:uncharacterized membrane protein YczE
MENQNSWKKPLILFGIIFIALLIFTLVAFEGQFHPIALGYIFLIQALIGFVIGLVRSLSRKSDSDTEAYGQKLLLLSMVCLLISFGVCSLGSLV